MKLKRIEALCKVSGRILLYNKSDENGEVTEQWIGDGCAVYPLYGLPYMEMEHIVNIFGLNDKQTEKMMLRHETFPTFYDVSDSAAGETRVETEAFSIVYADTVLLPVTLPGGEVVFIQDKYYAPLRIEKDDTELYLRRTADGGSYFAAKAGLMIAGLIMPYIPDDEGFKLRLRTVAQNMKIKEIKEG